MFPVYVVVTIVAAAANIFSAMCDFVRYKQVSIAMARAGSALTLCFGEVQNQPRTPRKPRH